MRCAEQLSAVIPEKWILVMPKSNKAKTGPIGRKYTIYFVPDEIAGGYTAHIPALGIVTKGETLREATAMAKDAIEGWIEAAEELGKPIPEDAPNAGGQDQPCVPVRCFSAGEFFFFSRYS
jgi:predicted RNase H-like HicB family nuclease